MDVHIKRIYEPASPADGYRILTDRLWPRGIRKEDAHIDQWLKDIAPSTALRTWFQHDPEKWIAFRQQYFDEIKGSEALQALRDLVQKHPTVTLLFAARDEQHNHTRVLQELLKR